MVEMGECTGCGHRQPGTNVDGRIEPLAEGGCAHCSSERFVLADSSEDGSPTPSYRHLADRDAIAGTERRDESLAGD